ncbi:hypothetical protein B0H11DRAFT_1922252 [Mycena galericulata]|nr:hypothetical protein B0H11DRAFT_1922252 [Mycena galericulata]
MTYSTSLPATPDYFGQTELEVHFIIYVETVGAAFPLIRSTESESPAFWPCQWGGGEFKFKSPLGGLNSLELISENKSHPVARMVHHKLSIESVLDQSASSGHGTSGRYADLFCLCLSLPPTPSSPDDYVSTESRLTLTSAPSLSIPLDDHGLGNCHRTAANNGGGRSGAEWEEKEAVWVAAELKAKHGHSNEFSAYYDARDLMGSHIATSIVITPPSYAGFRGGLRSAYEGRRKEGSAEDISLQLHSAGWSLALICFLPGETEELPDNGIADVQARSGGDLAVPSRHRSIKLTQKVSHSTRIGKMKIEEGKRRLGSFETVKQSHIRGMFKRTSIFKKMLPQRAY